MRANSPRGAKITFLLKSDESGHARLVQNALLAFYSCEPLARGYSSTAARKANITIL